MFRTASLSGCNCSIHIRTKCFSCNRAAERQLPVVQFSAIGNKIFGCERNMATWNRKYYTRLDFTINSYN